MVLLRFARPSTLLCQKLRYLSSSSLRMKHTDSTSKASGHFLQSLKEVKSGAGPVNLSELSDTNKALLVYFSAGWCPSCKLFTPKMKKFYEATMADGLRVLWISKDKSADDQLDYYGKSLPNTWLYVPFGKENHDFFKLYDVKTIPALRLVDEEGTVVDDAARTKVESSVVDNAEQSPSDVLAEWKAMLAKHRGG